jgi:hypothetical protein
MGGRTPQRHSLLFIGSEKEPEKALGLLRNSRPSDVPIPNCILEGILKSLLGYFIAGGKKKRNRRRNLSENELRVAVARLTGRAEGLAANYAQRVKSGELPLNLAHEFHVEAGLRVEQILDTFIHHPNRLHLETDSDLVLLKLGPYDKVKQHQRLRWLRTNLPEIFSLLKRMSTCVHPNCLARIEPPSESDLKRWTNASKGKLRHHILAHFHGSTESNTIRTLSS